MTVLELISGALVNGAVVHCMLLSRALASRGHHVLVGCRPGAWIAGQLRDSGAQVTETDMCRWPRSELRRMASLAAAAGVDVLHTHMTRAHHFGVALSRASGIPCVATAHAHRMQLHWMLADRVIAVSEATRRYHRTHNLVRSSRIEVVHGFADCDSIEAVPQSARCEVRRELGVDAETRLIGLVGDLVPRKGQLAMIRALPAVLHELPDVHVVLAGEPKGHSSYQEAMCREASRLGVGSRIRWLGHRSDVPRLLRALDLYVMTSLDEMLPVAVLEAMASGVPVVATAVGGVPECVRHGETGLLVPAQQPGRLAEAVLSVLRDDELRAALATNARLAVREHFSVASQTPLIEEALMRAARLRDR